MDDLKDVAEILEMVKHVPRRIYIIDNYGERTSFGSVTDLYAHISTCEKGDTSTLRAYYGVPLEIKSTPLLILPRYLEATE